MVTISEAAIRTESPVHISPFGFVNRGRMAADLRNLAERGDPTLITQIALQQGILKFRYSNISLSSLEASNLRSIITPERWNSFLTGLQEETGISLDGIYPLEEKTSSVRNLLTKGLFKIEAGLYVGYRFVDRQFDRVSETLNPDLRRMGDIYRDGINTAEDIEILSRAGSLTAGLKSAGTFTLALAGGVATLFALASVFAVSLPTIAIPGMAAAFAYSYIPGFRDTVHGIVKAIIPLGLGIAARTIAHKNHMGWVTEILAGYATFIGSHAVVGMYNRIKENRRIATLMRDQAPLIRERQILEKILDELYDLKEAQRGRSAASEDRRFQSSRNSSEEKIELFLSDLNEEKLLSDVQKTDLRSCLLKVRDAIRELNQSGEETTYAEIHQARNAKIDQALSAVYDILRELRIPEFHVPNQKLTAFARMAKTLGLVYLLPLSQCFTNEMQLPIESKLFAAAYLAQLFNAYGSTLFTGTVEIAEHVEPTQYPKVKIPKSQLPILSMLRYTLDGFPGDSPMESLVYDILARVQKGNYRVVVQNGLGTGWLQVRGFVMLANRYDARIAIVRQIIDTVPALQRMNEEQKDLLAATLSVKEKHTPAHRVVDDVAYAAYDNAPTEGQVVRFRDSLGAWHGERVTLDAMTRLFDERLSVEVEDGSLRSKYVQVLRDLPQAVFVQKDFNLEVLYNHSALRNALKRLDSKNRLSEEELDDLVSLVERNRKRYLTNEMRRYAHAAGIDSTRAYIIAQDVTDKLQFEKRGVDPVAELGNELILLRQNLSPERRQKLVELLGEEFNLETSAAEDLISAVAGVDVEAGSRDLLKEYDFSSHDLIDYYYKVRAFMEVSRTLQLTGAANTEEANYRKIFASIMKKDQDTLTPGETAFKNQILKIIEGSFKKAIEDKVKIKLYGQSIRKEDPSSWTPAEQFDFLMSESSLELTLAIKIEYEALVHGFLEKGLKKAHSRFTNAKELSEEIGAVLAQHQIVASDWTSQVRAKMGLGLSREAAEHEVWQEWLDGMEPLVKEIVINKLKEKGFYSKERINQGSGTYEEEIVWDIIKTELTRHKQNVDAMTHGALQLFAQELDGIRTITKQLPANPKLMPIVDKIKASKARQAALTSELQDRIGSEEVTSVLAKKVKSLLKLGMGSMWRGGNVIQGYLRPFDILIDEIPQVILGNKDLVLPHEGEEYLIAKRTEKGDGDLKEAKLTFGQFRRAIDGADNKESILSTLTELTKIEAELYEQGMSLRELIASYEHAPDFLPGNQRAKLLDRATPTHFAETVIGLVKPTTTAANLQTELQGKIVDIVNNMLKLEARTRNNRARLHWNGSPIVDLLKELDGTITKGTVRRRNNPTLSAQHKDLVLTHLNQCFARAQDLSSSKAEYSSTIATGARVEEKQGVILRNVIRRLVRGQAGYFDIPEEVHNQIKDDVVRLIRLRADETEDAESKLERGITPDDIARKLIFLIWNRGLSPTAAARLVWREMWEEGQPAREERKTTRAYNRNELAIGEIKANLYDAAEKIALLTCAHEVLGVTAAYMEALRRNSEFDQREREHPYMKQLLSMAGAASIEDLIQAKPRLGSILNRLLYSYGRRLNAEQRRALRHWASDTRRKLEHDAEIKARIEWLEQENAKLEDEKQIRQNTIEIRTLGEEVLYKCPWYCVPALWTPRDKTNVAKQFIGIEKMRRRTIIPRAQTLEEIAAFLCSKQGKFEWVIEEGRAVEDAINMRKIARIGDELLGIQPRELEEKPALIKDHTEAAYQNWQAEEKRITSLISGEVQRKEEAGEAIRNSLDTRRFDPTLFEKLGATFFGNFDTDNIVSKRFLELLPYMGYHHGMLIYWGDAFFQAGHDNYEYQGGGNLMRAQYDKDHTLSRNMWLARVWRSALGVVRNRSRRARRVAFPVGYANFKHLDGIMEWAYTVTAANWADKAMATQDDLFLSSFKGKLTSKVLWLAKWGSIAALAYSGADYLAEHTHLVGNLIGNLTDLPADSTLWAAGIYGLSKVLSSTKWWHFAKRATWMIPWLGLAYAGFTGIFAGADAIPGIASAEMAAAVVGGGYLVSKALKTSPVPTIFGAYLAASALSGGFSGHEFWQIAGWAGAANAIGFDLLPRIANKINGKTLKLNQYYRGSILYNILSVVEDAATSLAIYSKGFHIAGNKGAFQWNDAVTNIGVLSGQYDRWFGGTGEAIREAGPMFYAHRQALTLRQWADMFSIYLYPQSTLAADANRLTLVALSALWIPALLLLNPETNPVFLQQHLGWICELGIAAFIMCMLTFRASRAHEGAQEPDFWEILKGLKNADRFYNGLGSVGRHLMLETATQPPVRAGTMKKVYSGIRTTFTVTQNFVKAMKINYWDLDEKYLYAPWYKRLYGYGRGSLNDTTRFMGQNWLWMSLFGFLSYKVIDNNLITDGFEYKDFSSLPMFFVSFWMLYEAQKLLLGRLFLNWGVEPLSEHRKWEQENRRRLLEAVDGRAESDES